MLIFPEIVGEITEKLDRESLHNLARSARQFYHSDAFVWERLYYLTWPADLEWSLRSLHVTGLPRRPRRVLA